MGESLWSDETNNEATELSNPSGEAHEVTEPVSRPQSDRKSREGAEVEFVPPQICANLVIIYKNHLVYMVGKLKR